MIHTLSLITSILAFPFAVYCLYSWYKADEDKWFTLAIGTVASTVHLINIIHGGI